MNRSRAGYLLVGLLPACLLGCSADDVEPGAPTQPLVEMEPDLSAMGGDRPVEPFVPSTYRSSVPTPLVIVLHGYGVSGAVQDLYFRVAQTAESRGFIYLAPDGTFDGEQHRFWNASKACCGFGTEVDDSRYVAGLITEAKTRFNIDPKRVYLWGHSNGGFMAYRMVCDHASQLAAIVSLAGAMSQDLLSCDPSEPVHVLQIHGTTDTVVKYEGGVMSGGGAYLGARQTAEHWAQRHDCGAPSLGEPIDMSLEGDGAETLVERYTQGCRAGGEAELWTMQETGHIPSLSAEFPDAVVDFMFAHPKP